MTQKLQKLYNSKIQGWCNFMGGIVTVFFVNLLGRKLSVNLGLFLICLSHIINMIGIHFEIVALIYIGVGTFLFFFGSSIGSLIFVVGAESLPAALGPVVGTALWGMTVIISYFTLPLINALGIVPIYTICLGCSFIMGIFFVGYGVETKNKTLSQVTKEYNLKKFMRSVKKEDLR